jgi:hypothetical protein
MQLPQRNSATLPPSDLQDWDDEMDTGEMTECVSVIVLWDPDEAGRFRYVRGYHGGGGIAHVNFQALFYNVPNDFTTLILLISGSSYRELADQQKLLETCRKKANKYGLAQATVGAYHSRGRAVVHRLRAAVESTVVGDTPFNPPPAHRFANRFSSRRTKTGNS